MGGLSMQTRTAPNVSGFASAQGNFRMVFVQSAMDLTSYRACESWLKSMHAVVRSAMRPSERRVGRRRAALYRTPVFVQEIASSMQQI